MLPFTLFCYLLLSAVCVTAAGRLINPGHAIEAGWFLLEYAQLTGSNAFLGASQRIPVAQLQTSLAKRSAAVSLVQDRRQHIFTRTRSMFHTHDNRIYNLQPVPYFVQAMPPSPLVPSRSSAGVGSWAGTIMTRIWIAAVVAAVVSSISRIWRVSARRR